MRAALLLSVLAVAGCDNLLGLTPVGDAGSVGGDGRDTKDAGRTGDSGPPSNGLIMHVTFDSKRGDSVSCTADTAMAYTFQCHDDGSNDIQVVAGRFGSAFAFANSTYLTGEQAFETTTTGLTVSFWFEAQASNISGCVLGKNGADTATVWTACLTGAGSGEFSSSSSVGLGWNVPFGDGSDSGFHMASLTWDPTHNLVESWFDGELGSATTAPGGLVDSSGSLTVAGVLSSAAQATAFYTGPVDDLWIYDRALGSAEIQSLYTQ